MSKYGFKELIGALIKARGRFGPKLVTLLAGVVIGAAFAFVIH